MRRQRGFVRFPSAGELLGCLAVVAGFFVGVGVVLAIAVPKVWAWLKPIIHGATA